MPKNWRLLSLGGSSLALALGLGLPSTALAVQPPPGGLGGPGGAPTVPTGGGSDDKDGPAEAAPKDKGALAPVTPVPAQPEGRRRLQLFELHGNLRMRADFFHRLDLALAYNDDETLEHKFFIPPAEMPETNESGVLVPNDANCASQLSARGVTPARIPRRCNRRRGFGGGNMRLRLQPTIHVTDTVKVHAQLDLLDNMVLGSTPDSFLGENPWAPNDLFTRTQYPQQSLTNSWTDSIVVKRAWGEIRFGFGMTLEFGRMPNHWGLGIVQNDGNGYDRQEKGDIMRMIDTDYGDSVDTVRLSFDFGADKRRAITLGVSYDWAASGPTTAQLLGPEWASGNLVAQTFSAELYDNVHQFSLWVERHDDPSMLRRKLSTGNAVVNYGFKTWARWQTLDRVLGTTGFNYDLASYSASLVHRRGWMVTPDLWLRVNWRTMRIEAEGAMIVGGFRRREFNDETEDPDFDLSQVTADSRTGILQGGYALEFKYGLFKDRFHIGLDQGFASGDSTPPQQFQYQSPYPVAGGDYRNLGTFRFNPAYVQDMLLFKELLGTVANAAYVKPWAAFYFFQNNFSARADVEFAGAVNPSGTLAGDRSLWGLELAGAVRYHDAEEPIFFQVQYGAMFPFGAWNAVRTFTDSNGDPVQNRDDSRAAQTVQAQLGVRF